ncbi:MAG TPA: MMPL family transporter [Candidatus Nanopelagicaceae bacterium]|nr:MMPL family transporter [Candidatus Nanopelagicaceae bacterium]
MKSFGGWAFRNKFIVFLIWIAAFAGVTATSHAVGSRFNDSFSLPGIESTKALSLLSQAFPRQAGDADSIVFHVNSGTVNDPKVKKAMVGVFSQVSAIASVGSVKSPYDPQNVIQISRDQRTAYASVVFSSNARTVPSNDVQSLISIGSAARSANLQVEFGGQAIAQLNRPKGNLGEMIGVMAAAVILFISFGSFLAMLLPIGVALLALGTASAVVGLLTHLMGVASFAPQLGSLIGLGVGIDYALFIVSRYRKEIADGVDPEEAASISINTSGRAVLFAGATVCIALLGLLVLGLSFLNGVAVAASVTVLITMIATITLLPALFGVIKRHVFSRRSRGHLDAGTRKDPATGYWARWARTVSRKPIPLAVVAFAIIAVLAIPYFSLHLGSSDQGNNPPNTTTRKAYDLLAGGFGPGTNGPLQVIAEIKSQTDRSALEEVATALKSEPGVAEVSPVISSPTGMIAFLQVIPTTGPQDIKTSNLIKDMRQNLIPKILAGSSTKIYVGGATAIFDDFASVIAGKLPLFITVIVLLGGLLLLLAFRSFAIPLTAGLMNLFAAGASFGVVVAAFQWGWGQNLLNVGKGPIESFLPVIMLAILFGLSMDYQVFLVSRMHEEWINTEDNSRSVITGQADTGRIITSAALIMIAVFCSFIFGGEKIIKEFGIGLAAAVFIDAFILRTILVPALMHLFGRANWWIPKSVDKMLPHLSVEATEI